MAKRVEQEGLQGNILCGYGTDYRHGLFGFFHVDEPAAGQKLLQVLLKDGDGITNAVQWPKEAGRTRKPTETRNVALTCAGLAAVGVPEETLELFPVEFREGMAERSELLGDTGPNHPDVWDDGLKPGQPHILVTIFTVERDARDARLKWLQEIEAATPGLELVNHLETDLLGDPSDPISFGREHFGFADGLSQPSIADPNAGPTDAAGKGTPRRIGWNEVKPGEFVLGYEDEEGLEAGAGLPRRLARNGSYMVVRKLHQDVAAFNQFLTAARVLGGLPEELVAAKLIGRWRSGAPLALAPDADDLTLTATGENAKRMNDFRFGDDAGGLKCPVGAHIRRTNPRDALGWQGKLTKRHRIIRRGMPYGEPPRDPLEPDDDPRGLMFVCFQASIERQFEVIQDRWMNDGDVFGLGSDRDFLAAEGAESVKYTIPWAERPPSLLAPLPRLVTTKGGDYFFAPGLFALERLAMGEPVAD